MRMLRVLSSAIALIGFTSVASAGTITGAASVTTNMGEQLGREAVNMINQSGLSANYVSGVDDFDLFIAGSPLHTSLSTGTDWVSTYPNVTGYIEFDLGSVMTVNEIAIWNFALGSGVAVTAFDVSGDATDLGSFGLPVPSNPANPASAHVIDLGGAVDAQRIRFDITSNAGSNFYSGLGEVAFHTGDDSGGSSTSPVPEPGAALVFGVGMMLVAYRNRALA